VRRPEWETAWRIARKDRRAAPAKLKREKALARCIDRETREEIAQLDKEKTDHD
jgi:hypothetical protein